MADLGIKGLKFTSSPHISYGERPCDLMRLVIVSLIPIAVYGVMLFGLDALLKIIVSVACAIGFEALFQYLTKQQITVKDCSRSSFRGKRLSYSLPTTNFTRNSRHASWTSFAARRPIVSDIP